MDVKRFADAGVLAAVADRAVATTLVTTEGRALTDAERALLQQWLTRLADAAAPPDAGRSHRRQNRR